MSFCSLFTVIHSYGAGLPHMFAHEVQHCTLQPCYGEALGTALSARPKYLNNCWMDRQQILYRLSWFPIGSFAMSLGLWLWCTDFSASITTMSTFLLVSKMSQPIGWSDVKKKKALVKFPSSPKYIFLPLVPEYLSFTVWNDVCRVWHQRAVSTFIAETVNFVWAHWKPDLKRRAYELDLWHRKIIWMDPGPICKLYNCDVES